MDILLSGALDDEEFLLMYETYNENEKYTEPFDLNSFTERQCNTSFCFEKRHIGLLAAELAVPDKFTAPSGTAILGIEGLCIVLRRLAYPNRLSDLSAVFGRSVSELSYIHNSMMNYLYNTHRNQLTSLNQTWLSPLHLRMYADAIYGAGAPLDNCWGFIDGTLRPMCRPSTDQHVVFNGQKRVHGLKFQSVVTPNGLIAHLYGPFEGKRHDAGMLRASQLLTELERTVTMNDGTIFSLYEDLAYPLRPHLITPFRGARLNAQERLFNQQMSSVRVIVEWAFGKVLNNFAFFDFMKNKKLYLQPIGLYYTIGILLTNFHTYLYGSEIGEKFQVAAPGLHEYLHG